jgi:hypothetical protein
MLDAQELSEDVVPPHGKGSGRLGTLSCCSDLSGGDTGGGGVAGVHCIIGGKAALLFRVVVGEFLDLFLTVTVLDSARRCHDVGLMAFGESCASSPS